MSSTVYMRIWRARNPEAWAKYYQAHRLERLAYRRQRYAQHKAEEYEAKLRYYAAHPEKKAEYSASRRARKRGAFVEVVDRLTVLERDAGVCGECWAQGFPGIVDPSDWHLDHIKPLSKGGEHSYENVQVTHPVCNLQKYAR